MPNGVDSRWEHPDGHHIGALNPTCRRSSSCALNTFSVGRWRAYCLQLALAVQDGSVHSYLAAAPASAAAHGSCIAVLSSLQEATVVDVARPGVRAVRLASHAASGGTCIATAE